MSITKGNSLLKKASRKSSGYKKKNVVAKRNHKNQELRYTLKTISKCCHCPTSVTYIFHSTFSTFRRYLHDSSNSDNHYSLFSAVNVFPVPYSYYLQMIYTQCLHERQSIQRFKRYINLTYAYLEQINNVDQTLSNM